MKFNEAVNNYLYGIGNTRVEIKDKLLDYIHKNPRSNIYQLRQWVEEQGIKEDLNIEEMAFEIISEYIQFIKGGLWNESGMPTVKEEELNMGIQLEYKHTTNINDAKRIALNNLTEIPDYYTRLIEMKKQAGIKVQLVKQINGNNYLVTM